MKTNQVSDDYPRGSHRKNNKDGLYCVLTVVHDLFSRFVHQRITTISVFRVLKPSSSILLSRPRVLFPQLVKTGQHSVVVQSRLGWRGMGNLSWGAHAERIWTSTRLFLQWCNHLYEDTLEKLTVMGAFTQNVAILFYICYIYLITII